MSGLPLNIFCLVCSELYRTPSFSIPLYLTCNVLVLTVFYPSYEYCKRWRRSVARLTKTNVLGLKVVSLGKRARFETLIW